jgi:glycosyltransferase involved in cell wall biosynthesis
MTKQVFINGKFLAQRLTGVQRYALETLLAMDGLIADGQVTTDFELTLLAPEGTVAPKLRAIGFRHVGPFSGHLWEQLTLARASRGALLWSFSALAPLLKQRQAVTIHDAAVRMVPQAYGLAFRALYELMLPVLARRSAQVMTVSEFSRGEIARCFGADARETRVTGEGWQHATRLQADTSILTTHGLAPRSYVFAASSVTPHKNFAVVARAIEALGDRGLQLVVAGESGHKRFGSVDMSGMRSVKFVGYVSDEQLRALYEQAAVFVFPSLYEGFGLPPLEAMAFGCPVIASSAASIPEVCGDAAAYFEPHDDAQLAGHIERLLSDPSERDRLVARGRERLAHHSWTACAREHLSAMAHTLAA